jgi:hypothetical protein
MLTIWTDAKFHDGFACGDAPIAWQASSTCKRERNAVAQ